MNLSFRIELTFGTDARTTQTHQMYTGTWVDECSFTYFFFIQHYSTETSRIMNVDSRIMIITVSIVDLHTTIEFCITFSPSVLRLMNVLTFRIKNNNSKILFIPRYNVNVRVYRYLVQVCNIICIIHIEIKIFFSLQRISGFWNAFLIIIGGINLRYSFLRFVRLTKYLDLKKKEQTVPIFSE